MAEPPVVATPVALEAIERLLKEGKQILFYQSGGCCEGQHADVL
ncbi:MAG: hypothetical protein ACP5IL_11220 [Syntrophobacteraceae bacterium]